MSQQCGAGLSVRRDILQKRRGFRRMRARSVRYPYSKENSMNNLKRSSLALAAAAATMFSFVSVASAADAGAKEEGKTHCEGVNSCKGSSACKTANNACKGQNSCKGMGFLEMSKAECDAAKEKLKADAAK
jgi:hypothetical protein